MERHAELTAEHRLASYGTLAPGRVNHHHVSMLPGRWLSGSLRGRLHAVGWGADLGFPALVLDPAGDEVAADVLESADLPAHWERLDAFEGEAYRRVVTTVETPGGPIEASVYVAAPGLPLVAG